MYMYVMVLVLLISSSKLQAQFQSMEVRNSCFASFIDVFTPNTYVMVIMSDPAIRKLIIATHLHAQKLQQLKIVCLSLYTASAATLVNIRNARKHFEKIERLESALPAAGPHRV